MIEVLCYLGSILLANWLVVTYHLVGQGQAIMPWFPIAFPAGAAIVGLTFSARDFVQRRYGHSWTWVWMLVATAITAVFNTKFAFASGTAFLVAEAIDWLIYSLSKRPFAQRIILSNLIGTPLDSVVFVCMAFGWNWAAIWGQTLVKFASSLLVTPFVRRKE
jgi:uncharacterized PurR-regulated membrane protein YhhQ (DUF165 family)